jgi:hypothetical protein
MRRAKRRHARSRRFLPAWSPDRSMIAGQALVDLLGCHMPRRWPRSWKLPRLDLRTLPLEQGLPSGVRCKELNLAGTALRALPADLRVSRALDLHDCKHLRTLPPGLRVERLDLRSCTALTALPEGLRVGYLDLRGCTALTALPRDLRCGELDLAGLRLHDLPADLCVEHRLNLEQCRALRTLPAGLHVGILVLRGCRGLKTLPPDLNVFDLDLTRCTGLEVWPGPARVRNGRLQLAGCSRLSALPSDLTELELLDVSDCPCLRALPEGLTVRECIDVGGSGLTGLPASLRGTPLRWRGVAIDERIAFHPEQLTPEEVLHEPNAERRRVMLERYGLERLMRAQAAEVLDRDHDAGGRRELLCLSLPDEEPLVCVSVQCPSTGRRYVLRVPPTMRTCREAVAWTAGFDDSSDYRPVQES